MLSGKTMLAGLASVTLAIGAAPALAVPQVNTTPTSASKDPSRVICEKVQETGSRLNVTKVCMTAQQWEEQKRHDREAVEDAQRTRTEPSGH